MNINIRAVDPEKDAERLTEIYNPYIRSTTITYEYEELSPETFLSRINSVTAKYPYIVLETDGAIAGYAYASAFNPRKAYDWDADISIYLDMDCKGRGLGSLLMDKLLGILTAMGFVNAYSLIDIPNDASEAIHRKFGFTKTGEYNHSGWKFGRWLDMGIYSKRLSDIEIPHEIDRDWKKYL